jgi:hypothetical protein
MADTRAFWRLYEAGRFHFITSRLVFQEIVGAPERVHALMRTTFAGTALLPLSLEADELAAAYLAQKVVPLDYEDDAYHVAVCTVARLDYLVSWNFKHLANVRRPARVGLPFSISCCAKIRAFGKEDIQSSIIRSQQL